MPITGNELKLPKNVKPSNYAVTLEPNFTNFTFNGQINIDISVTKPSDTIELNASELEILSATLNTSGSSITADASLNEATEVLSLSFPETINNGLYTLNITFTGTLNDKLRGFYRSQYNNPEGETSYLATTQFEATDARKAFPCWDEPDAKATFDITLLIPENLTAISNMPEIDSTRTETGKKRVSFAKTPIMSTYLVAFVIGDIESIESNADNNTNMRIWTTRGKTDQAEFALNTATRLLSYFNDYFGIPFPLPKLDHIAIPDFAAGAMENWGAITYRETALLVDPHNSSAGTRQRVAEVIAHEMAHMWFGDLVTMEWWDDLWLNESFASWMGNKAVDWLFPDWAMWTQFVNMDTNRAFSLDGLENSHPIEQTVENPAEVSQLFDAISYSKGGSVLRMLEQFLGASVFQEGLTLYLTNNSYGNARTEHLWQALESSSGKPVTRIMDTWTSQTGYPVLRVQVDDKNILSLHQQRFKYSHILQTSDDDREHALWEIPISILDAQNNVCHSSVMENESKEIHIENISQYPWLKLNPEVSGFYRVLYSPEDWTKLKNPIAKGHLSPSDRLEVQNDAYALSRSGHLPVDVFLDIASIYKNETDASVWSDLATNLKEIELLISEKPYLGQYREFGKNLFSSVASEVGWTPKTNDSHLTALLRSVVLSQSGGYGDPEAIGKAREFFNQYISNPETVPADLRGIVFSLVAQNGDSTVYKQMWDLERETTLQEEKIRLLIAMARFSSPDILTDLLNQSIGDNVRSQDTISVIGSVANNPYGKRLAWNFLKDNWSTLDERYGGGGFGLMRLVSITSGFASDTDYKDVESFFKSNAAPAAERSVRQSLERIKLNTHWINANDKILEKWLS
tara:strand:+ start:118544 stop:121126 length:2583 start_codon:yes stop_codon:yes gene_type:complete